MVNYGILGLLAIYLTLICYPSFLFAYSFKYENFSVYSTQPLDSNIQTILANAERNLASSEILNKTLTQNIYFCNGYPLYIFFAPLARNAFACNYPIIHNIFIANCDIDKNLAFKSDGEYTRRLHELITHETAHTLAERRLGFWKYRTLATWKKEGYSEYVGYNNAGALKDAKAFLATRKDDTSPEATYRKYYYAVTFLKEVEGMTFDDIIATNQTFEQVLDKIEGMTKKEK
jgi:hypothetical protein